MFQAFESQEKTTQSAKAPRQWVFIRGIVSESFHWWDFLSEMQKAFPGDSISTADILGNGQQNQHLTPTAVVPNILGLKKQVPEGKKILVGFSLGGMLSLEWAHAYPDEIEAVVLINCSLNNSKIHERMQISSFKNIVKLSLEKDLIEREKHTLRMTTSCLSENKISEIAKAWGARGVQFPVRTINFLRQSLLAAQISQRPSPPVPTLILSSENDRVVHPVCSERIAKNWNLQNHKHSKAGHDLTLDDPTWALEKISSFADSLLAAQSRPSQFDNSFEQNT